MASKFAPIDVVAAVAALFVFGKKKKNGDVPEAGPAQPESTPSPATPATPTPTPQVPGPAGMGAELPAPAPQPPNYGRRLMLGYKSAVDACIAELGYAERPDLKACALAKIFSESDALWPPPDNAHQWQRNVWNQEDLNSYIVEQMPKIT